MDPHPHREFSTGFLRARLEALMHLREVASDRDALIARSNTLQKAACESDASHVFHFDEERITLAAVERAIGRIDSGDYGECVDCGGLIALHRLTAIPYAARCYPCQDAYSELGRTTITFQ